jgi:FkbM family methyltransferase
MDSPAQVVRDLVKRARPGWRDDLGSVVRWVASHRRAREAFNGVHLRLGVTGQARLHAHFSRVLYGATRPVDRGSWRVRFAGREIIVPIDSSHAGLSWDAALSLLGHDHEVKQTYAAILESRYRPDLFIDVGANFGTHSLLFLRHGIETWSYEPNSACHWYFQHLCDANSLAPSVRASALSDEPGQATLCFPEQETWLGRLTSDVSNDLKGPAGWRSEIVPVAVLDQVLEGLSARRILIKIDTEGNEARVLRGARATLRERRPIVIFESLGREERDDLYALFAQVGYVVAQLPWRTVHVDTLSRDAFHASPAQNFLALPCEFADPS